MRVKGHERRICAGDWVRLIGSTASIRGLGKVVDAEYDPADDALRLAQVEFARGVHWFAAADLRRIESDEEVRLTEGALEIALMPEPARDRIKAALVDYPRSRTARSLGLLDLLWSLLGSLPNERAVKGLARFFDEGGPEKKTEPLAVAAKRAHVPVPIVVPGPAPRPAAPRPEHADPSAYDPIATTISPPRLAPSPAPAPIRRAVSVVEEILASLNHGPLSEIAKRTGITIDRRTSIATARETVLATAELSTILDVLTPNQLERVAAGLAIATADRPVLTLAILQRAAPRNAGELLRRFAISPVETRFLLGLLSRDELIDLAAGMGYSVAFDHETAIIDRIIEAAAE